MKEVNIVPPDGYEIDKENSTFEKIVFKEVKKIPKVPMTWEELDLICGYYVNDIGEVLLLPFVDANYNKNVFKTKQQAQASIALAQLSQLREVYRDGWKPDWDTSGNNFVIQRSINELGVECYTSYSYFLSFQTREIAELFLNNFRDLIEEASPLLFD